MFMNYPVYSYTLTAYYFAAVKVTFLKAYIVTPINAESLGIINTNEHIKIYLSVKWFQLLLQVLPDI